MRFWDPTQGNKQRDNVPNQYGKTKENNPEVVYSEGKPQGLRSYQSTPLKKSFFMLGGVPPT